MYINTKYLKKQVTEKPEGEVHDLLDLNKCKGKFVRMRSLLSPPVDIKAAAAVVVVVVVVVVAVVVVVLVVVLVIIVVDVAAAAVVMYYLFIYILPIK
jgi:hypothetical protein